MQNEKSLLNDLYLSESSTSSSSSSSSSCSSSSSSSSSSFQPFSSFFSFNSQLISSSNDGDAIISKAEQVGSGDDVTVKPQKEETKANDLDENNGCDRRVEQEDEQDRASKKRKKDRCGGFIVDQAEVDDKIEDDDDEIEERKESAREMTNDKMDESVLIARDIEEHRRNSNLLESHNQDMDYRERKNAGCDSVAAHNSGDGDEKMLNEMRRPSLLPDDKGPKLWMVQCRKGYEESTAILLRRKCMRLQSTSNALEINSVVSRENVKGYIYIEASNEAYVRALGQGVSNINLNVCKMVPINEMPDIMCMKKQTEVMMKQWARIKRGIYKGDIAQVLRVDSLQKQIYLKLLPRIDYTKRRDALKTAPGASHTLKRKRNEWPAAKPFDPAAIRAIGGKVKKNGNFFIFERDNYCRKGFLYKNYSINAITRKGVEPTQSELEIFVDAVEETHSSTTTQTSEKENQVPRHSFSNGDRVKVCEGEWANLRGKIVSTDENMIMVMPEHNQLKEAMPFQASELQKCFEQGDHVKVLAENCRDGYGDGIDGRDDYADREGYGDTKCDGLIGASVKIISGRYKTYIGEVKSTIEDVLCVRIHSSGRHTGKSVLIPLSHAEILKKI